MIETIRQALAESSPGVWRHNQTQSSVVSDHKDIIWSTKTIADCYRFEDAKLIANAPKFLRYLLDLLDAKDAAHTVTCQGICTSQADDYCGMHMSNETCISCNAIWTAAHVENAQRKADAQIAERDATIAKMESVPGYGAILVLKDRAEQAEALRGERDHLRNMVEIVLYHYPVLDDPINYESAYDDLKKQIEKEYYKAPWIEVPGKEETNA